MLGIARTARRTLAPVTDDSYPAAHRVTVQSQLDEMGALDVVDRYLFDHPELEDPSFEGFDFTPSRHLAY